MNEDFASAKLDEGLRMLAEGEGVHAQMKGSAKASK